MINKYEIKIKKRRRKLNIGACERCGLVFDMRFLKPVEFEMYNEINELIEKDLDFYCKRCEPRYDKRVSIMSGTKAFYKKVRIGGIDIEIRVNKRGEIIKDTGTDTLQTYLQKNEGKLEQIEQEFERSKARKLE